MAAKCPNIAAWGSGWIEQAHTYYLNRADQFYGMISQNLAVLDAIMPKQVPFNFHFNAPQALTTFVRPLTCDQTIRRNAAKPALSLGPRRSIGGGVYQLKIKT